jgi:alkanesulfonate monooxygenase SsuD/methylene tetrahydromethanopterin reductase-like flavin-dependent oxidoreductase (luciferase family)
MHGGNKLQIGLFGANCSSGRAVTLVPERWSGSWPDNKKLALMADRAGIDFLLPIGRWKGYGGTTDYQGTTLETITWATALLAATKRITVFGTVHAPIFNPVVAAKEMVTADHVGEGRFGLNIVVGWNEGEFDMFGVEQRAHEQRYEYAQEWIDVIKMIWSDREGFDFHGKYLNMKGIRGKPKPYGGTRPVIMNAGASATGQAFAVKNCDAFFLQASRTSLEESAQRVGRAKEAARARPRNWLLHSRRCHLPIDQERSRRLFSSLHRGARRLVGCGRHPGAEKYFAADRTDARISHPAQSLCAGHGRLADRRRSGSRRRADRRSEQSRAHRHCHFARQLPRRTAVFH